MAIFDDAVNKTKDVANAVGRKASEIVEEVRLNLKISDVQSEIEKKYTEIGRFIYDSKKSGEEANLNIDTIVREIDELFTKYSDLKKAMAELKNRIICPKCNNANPEENAYCSFCGEKLDKTEQ